jgi:hypothetical protein
MAAVPAALLGAYHAYQIAQRDHGIDMATAQCKDTALSMFDAHKAAFANLNCADKDNKGTPAECLFGPPKDPEDVLSCDSVTLEIGDAGDLKPVQMQILVAEAKSKYYDWPARAAWVVALLSAVPWLWYFLLHRIAELRGAITGNPPDGW